MLPSVHVPDDVRELLEVQAFRREQGHALEEWDDRPQQRASFTDDVDERAIAPAVRLDVATAEALTNELEDFRSIAVLTDMLRCLCGSPSIPLSFSLAAVLPRRGA